MAISKVIYKTSAQDTGTVWIDSTPATAAAADILAPKTALLANGVLTTGTGSGGGGGGLEYETGTYTPASDISRPTISFANTHSVPPAFVMMSDVSDNTSITANSGLMFSLVDHYRFTGSGWPYSTSAVRYGLVSYTYMGSSSASVSNNMVSNNSDNPGTDQGYYRYYATESGFKPYCNVSSRYWRSGRNYKWIAVWGPTT